MRFEPKTHIFNLAARVGEKFDTVGFPIFSNSASNYNFACETKEDFTINSFVPFDGVLKTEAVLSNHSLPQVYGIGDIAPIPFWVAGIQYAVIPDKIHLAELPPVVKESNVYSRLQNYAEKRLQSHQAHQRNLEDVADNQYLLNRLLEDFSSSKYWISLYRDLLMRVYTNKMPIKNDVLKLGSDWIFQFAHKTDADTVMTFAKAFDQYRRHDKVADRLQSFAIFAHLAKRPSSYTKFRVHIRDEIFSSEKLRSYDDEFFQICRESPVEWSELIINRSLADVLIETNTSALTNYLKFIDVRKDIDDSIIDLAKEVRRDSVERSQWLLNRCYNFRNDYGENHPITKSNSKELVRQVVFVNALSALLGNRKITDQINSMEAGISRELYEEVSAWQK